MAKSEKKIKLLIAADGRCSKQLLDIVADNFNAQIEEMRFDTIGIKGVKRFNRHLSYFLVAYKVFRQRDQYDFIIFWQQFMGFYYSLLSLVSLSKKKYPTSIVLHLIYIKRSGVLGKIYKRLWKSVIYSKVLDNFVCHSSQEREHYMREFEIEDPDRILFVRYGKKMPDNKQTQDKSTQKDRYFFSGGASNRDYETLIKAFGGVSEHLKIACRVNDVPGIEIPPNVQLIHNAFGDDFLNLMKNSYAVIIPLNDPNISSGQLVLLDVMRFGKSSIVTKGSCTEDYINRRCVMLIEPQSVEDIKSSIDKIIHNQKIAKSLAINARLLYEKQFTIENYGQRISKILNNVAQGQLRGRNYRH